MSANIAKGVFLKEKDQSPCNPRVIFMGRIKD